jgi:hypothetical protein
MCSNQLSYVAKCTAYYTPMWLGYLDSNQGMPVSKTGALPLGDIPSVDSYPRERIGLAGVPGFEPGNAGIKNRCLTAWRYPIRLPKTEMVREARLELAHLAAPEPKSGASTNFATPAKKMVATTGFEPVTPSL